jgi:hypothetical protein
MLRTLGCALVISLLLHGCTEITGVEQARVPTTAEANKAIPPDDPVDDPDPADGDFPPEFDTPPTIISTDLDSGFHDRLAYVTARMEYYGNRARQAVWGEAQKGAIRFTLPRQESYQEHVLPWRRTLHTGGAVLVDSDCGFILNAHSSHHAWSEARSPSGSRTWAGQQEANSRPAAQPSCSGSGSGGPPPPGSGETGMTCYYIDTYLFVLWLDTGEVTYLGPGGSTQYCEPYHT